MQIFGTLLMVIVVGILLAGALSFSFVLLLWFLGVAVVAASFVLLRQLYYRWRFLYYADKQTKQSPRVIDAEYKDISDKK